ncbi:CLEC1A isoform 2 [Pan troglodytes]|uniref:CLEC1A isoform 2 n=1 Tax=Pan troglodytes TaxID=9598 RepID=A0A2J8QQQ3_PANTR|nr:CLEC1A isoform 2 [Pan troglodytes]
MQAKYSSTRDMLDDDGDTTMSLHSQASATTRRPEPRRTGWSRVARSRLTAALTSLAQAILPPQPSE